MAILGIDNGLDGGLVFLGAQFGDIQLKVVMPTVDAPDGKGREYDIPEIVRVLRKALPIERACLERAQAFPGQGVVSMFTIGKGYGIMLGILGTLGVSYEVVRPKAWQKVMLADMAKGDTKAGALIVCKRLWPAEDWRATERCKKAHDGLTDAALIAEHGRRVFLGGANGSGTG